MDYSEENGILIECKRTSTTKLAEVRDLFFKKAIIINFSAHGMDVVFDIYCFETNKIFKNCRTFSESFNKLISKRENILVWADDSEYLIIKTNTQ